MAAEIRDYIASQITPENIDELQRMAIASANGFNIALDGPPGVGKTQSILAFARLSGRTVFEKGCSEDTTENQIIGFPRLVEQNGATVTVYENGPLARAMAEGGIFYGDEFNLLRRDKQKRLNAAFDDRRRISRADGVEIEAKDGFLGVISYNPSHAFTAQDLEESVADRFIHFTYRHMPPKIEAYLGAFKIPERSGGAKLGADLFGIKLEKRAIFFRDDGTVLFLLYHPDRKAWTDFFTGAAASIENGLSKRGGVYYAHKLLDKHIVNQGGLPDETKIASLVQDYSIRVAGFVAAVRQLAKSGSSSLPQNVRTVFAAAGETGQVSLHLPSLRIHSGAVAHLVTLLRMGMEQRLAANYASGLLVNQICFGAYRDRKNGELSTHEIISCVAESFGLIPPGDIQKVNTRFSKNKV